MTRTITALIVATAIIVAQTNPLWAQRTARGSVTVFDDHAANQTGRTTEGLRNEQLRAVREGPMTSHESARNVGARVPTRILPR